MLGWLKSAATHWPYETCLQANDYEDTGKRRGDQRQMRCRRCGSKRWAKDPEQGTWTTTYRERE